MKLIIRTRNPEEDEAWLSHLVTANVRRRMPVVYGTVPEISRQSIAVTADVDGVAGAGGGALCVRSEDAITRCNISNVATV
jgi:hypothetical protein